MLVSLSIKNFVLIEDAVLDLADGLTVLTGETGAGKTLLTQALSLLLGDRASEGLVAEGADEAVIQGVFELSEEYVAGLAPEVVDLAALGAGELVVTRRLNRSGRNKCFLNAVAVPLGALSEVVGELVSFSGQHEHRRLLRTPYQRDTLDAFAGAEQLADRASYAGAWSELRQVAERLAERRQDRGMRDQEMEFLRFQSAELEAAALDREEEEALEGEQRLLARAEEVVRACHEVAGLLRGEGDAPDVEGVLSAARARLAGVSDVDPRLAAAAASLEHAGALIYDGAGDLRSFAHGLEVDPARLAAIDERLRVYSGMARKYGGTTASALAYLDEVRGRLRALGENGEDDMALTTRHDSLQRQCVALADALSSRRLEAASRLESLVSGELAQLGMPQGRVTVLVKPRATPEGLDAAGSDDVEFLLAANPGAPGRSLARTASGGELSRVLLAIQTALVGVEPAETLVFDEIDAGVGGLTATAVGARLRGMSRVNRLVVVTHLPQVAAYADRHVLVSKSQRGDRVFTCLKALGDEEAVGELSRMMGGRPGDPGAMEHARALRSRAGAGLLLD